MGDPYYCPECERNHIKGQIYKDHLQYAQVPDIQDEEEAEEIQVEQDGEDDTEEEDLEDEEYTDDEFEEEYEDDFDDDYDDEGDDEFEDDDDIDDDDIEVYGADERGVEECIEQVKDLSGVGEATLRKLIKAGFNSLESIAYTPPSIIQEDSGLGEKTTAKLIKQAMKRLNVGFKSAETLWEHRKNIARVTTGSQELDNLLAGGVETGSMIEFFGEFRTGKTQIMHQLCVNVQLPKEKGGIEGAALYIDTEGTFRPERIIQMAEALDLDYNKVLKNIVFGRAYNSDHQILLAKEAINIIKERNIKLIVIDSLIGHFRSEYIGRGTLATRQQILNQHLHDLLRLCDIYPDLAIVVTNQVQAKPDVFYGNPLQAAGGNIIAHGSTIRIYLRKGKGEQRVAKIVDAPHLPEGEAVFSITGNGISD
ncbi:MAG: DNA repair and recombination protein RadA [Candidatus Lokiarchaeota archaeon]|nr:DNA repair and recombination protein RadA [Candidatus Lokiarchaeota archaeon]